MHDDVKPGDPQGHECQNIAQGPMKEPLLVVGSRSYESPLPARRDEQTGHQPDLKGPSQGIAWKHEIEPAGRPQRGIQPRQQIRSRSVGANQPHLLFASGAEQFADLRVFDVQNNQQRRQEPKTQTLDGPGKERQRCRDGYVIELRIQGQQRTAKEKNKREAKEKEDAFKIPLPAVAEDDHHPKKRQERSRGQRHESKIDSVVHKESLPRFYAWTRSKAMTYCKVFLAPGNPLR